MHHTDAEAPVCAGLIEELPDRLSRLVGEHAVHVEFIFHAVMAITQFAKDPVADPVTGITQLVTGLKFRGADGIAEPVGMRGGLVAVALVRAGRGARLAGVGLVMVQASHIANRTQEFVRVIGHIVGIITRVHGRILAFSVAWTEKNLRQTVRFVAALGVRNPVY